MRHKIFFGAFMFANLFPSGGTFAQSAEYHSSHPIYWSNNGWEVYEYDDENMCEMSSKTVDGEHFTFAYLPRAASYSFILTNAAATSLRDGQSVSLIVVFRRNESLNLEWGQRVFDVRNAGITVAFTSPLLQNPIEVDMASSDQLALIRQGGNGEMVYVAGISLEGSAEAIVELKRCAFEAAELNPDDPFLR